MAKVKFYRDTEAKIKALQSNSKVEDGAIYIATDTGTQWMGTSATTLLQIKDNIDNNTWRPVVNNLTSTATDQSLSAAQGKALNDKFSSYVPTSRKVNGKALSADVTLSAGDVSAYSKSEIDTKLSGVSSSGHTHKNIVSLGNVTAESTKTGNPSVSGLSMQQAYSNGYPITYGNVLNMNGAGVSQMLVSWAGNGQTPASHMYFRGKTDGNVDDWSSWYKVYSEADKPTWSDIQSKPSTFTPSSHTHTKSQITDFPASIKNPNSLTIQGNGTNSFTYDGSAAKTLNIKPGSNVSVSSDTSGNITIASTNTWRGIQNNLTSTSTTDSLSAAQGKALNDKINALPNSMVFKGTVGTGGTATSLATAAAANNGHTYKVITAGTYGGTAAKVGDMLISNGSSWILIPSGDEPNGTVTNVATGTGLTGGPITTSGTISLASSGVTAGTYGPSANVTGSNGTTMSVPQITVDATGRVTSVTNRTLTNVDHTYSIPTSLKNPNALTISLNGSSQGAYDGSAAKSINITASSVGAASSSHNHDSSYVKKSGDTITGVIKASFGGSNISARDHVLVNNTNTAAAGNAWSGFGGQKTTNGHWAVGNLSGSENLTFHYTTDTNYSAGTNNSTDIQLPPTAGTLALTSQIPSVGNGTITITQNGTTKGSFTMNQSGNATIALTDTNTDTNTTYSAGTGLSLSSTTFNLNAATSSALGGVKVGSNITNSSGTISLTKANVTAALGYTPPTSDTNTWRPEEILVQSSQPSASTCKLWIKI